MRRRLLFAVASLLCSSLAAHAASPEPWTEVRSPHFRVLTDGSAHDGQKVAAEFEQMRYVFETSFPKITLDSGAPLTIFAGRDEATMKHLLPGFWKIKNAGNVAGAFSQGWEKQFAWVRLDEWGEGAHVTVYHEYTHSIMHMNLRWMPIWMDEGLAEFYGYTRFQSDKIYVGAPTQRYGVLRTRSLIPLETLLNVDQRSPYYHDADKVDLYYAESWALVHYMMFGPGMENGAKLARFYQALQDGTPQMQAFTSIFGDPRAMDKSLQLYVSRFTFSAGSIASPPALHEKGFATRKLSPAETEAEIAAFEIGEHEVGEGRQHLLAALAADPNLGLPHEENGFLLLREGKDAEAKDEFAKAYSLDNTLYRSVWAKTMLEPAPKTIAEVQARRTELYRVMSLNPKFAPVLVELALMDMARGDYKTALARSRQAEALQPWRAGYHLLSARILLAAGFPKQAAQFAQFVAERWHGPDHNEAVEIWDQVPASDRPAGVNLQIERPEGTEVAQGTVQEVKCPTAPGEGLQVVLDQGGKPLTFVTHGGYEAGFSDTLWLGEDHFTMCHHLESRRAVVYYRPGTAEGAAGQMVDAEIRVDPPTALADAAAAAGASPSSTPASALPSSAPMPAQH